MASSVPVLDRQELQFGSKPSRWFVDSQLTSASCVPEEGVGAYETLERYDVTPLKQQKIPRDYFKLPAAERDERIWALRNQLGDRLVILGHHYQRDEVIQFADFRGDSYKLSKEAATRTEADFILFCGVHFMAESADILSSPDQAVILPNLEAGCSMADMAKPDDVEAAWAQLTALGIDGIVPVTYMNSAASLKAFCGRNGGIVCTSSNASVSTTGRSNGASGFSSSRMSTSAATPVTSKGIPPDKMVVWDPFQPLGGNTEEALRNATVILWKGYCSVHARFSVEQIEQARRGFPDVNVIVHPECRLRVVQAADGNGSTEYIIDTIRDAPAGSTWAVGTEINLVNRLNTELPDKHIFCLDPVICPCSTMYRVHPAYVLWTLEHLAAGEVVNRDRGRSGDQERRA